MSYTNNFQAGKVYTYADADGLLQGRNKASKKLANNTYLIRLDGGGLAIRLHQTDIITINSDGSYTLNSGGWLTLTTKSRINEFSPASINQNKGVWYFADGSLFTDGVIVGSDGLPVDGGQDPKDYEKKLAAIKKDCRKYAKAYVKALKDGLINYPSGGDCWYCVMKTQDGQALGDATTNNDHLRSHIEDNYFVPALLVNAGREAGYQDMQIGLMGIGGQKVFIDPENNIYKYLVKRLRKDI